MPAESGSSVSINSVPINPSPQGHSLEELDNGLVRGTDYDSDSSESGSHSDSDSDSGNCSDDDGFAFGTCAIVDPSGDLEEGKKNRDEEADEDGPDTPASSRHNLAILMAEDEEANNGRGYMWPPGATLRVRFLDGSTKEHARIINHAKTWEKYANIHFELVSEGSAEIRVTLAKKVSYSMVGTQASGTKQSEATMSIANLPGADKEEFQAHVLHEFGHALGCVHEHSSPDIQIPWNSDIVYKVYTGPPNNWTRQQVKQNILNRQETTLHSIFDKSSIMLYPIDRKFTKNGFHSERNHKLSATDKQYIGKMYPFDRPGKGSGRRGKSKDPREKN